MKDVDVNDVSQLRPKVADVDGERDFTSASRPVLEALLRHDEGSRLHSDSVAAWSRRIARDAGASPAEVRFIERCALLHDVGKVFTPGELLRKPGPLTSVEWVRMKAHAAEGAAWLEEIPALVPYAAVVRAHHEHVDGRGYPHGLVRDQIPFPARIIGVADAFDAMISNRSYRTGLAPSRALDELRRCSGSQFDPAVVERLVSIIEKPRRLRLEHAASS